MDFDRLAHQLRNPVMVIRTLASLVRKRLAADDPNRPLLETIIGECQRIDLLLDGNLGSAELGPVELADLIERVSRAASALAGRHQVQFVHENPGHCRLQANGDALYEVLMILLDNAFKYTPPGGRVSLKVLSASDACAIEIADTGIGIEATELERVFEPYWRSSRVGTLNGQGLGLAIARDLVEQMAGRIEAESSVGTGSRFRVYLPVIGEA